LQVLFLPMTSVAPDGLNLVLFFTSHKVRGWSGVVCTMFNHFYIEGK